MTAEMREPSASFDTIHAQKMDAFYRRHRHIYDATRRLFLFGREQVLVDLQPSPGEILLEVGCGTARNLIRAAQRWPDLRGVGVDISAQMLLTARNAVNRAGLSDRITLIQGDAATAAAVQCDYILFSYSLSMMPDWRAAVADAWTCLRPGGSLHIVDFGALRGWARPALQWQRRWIAANDVKPVEDMQQQLRTLPGVASLRHSHMLSGYCDLLIVSKSAEPTPSE